MVDVKSDSAGYNAGALKQYVRQKEKPKLFSLFKNPFSKKPVIYDTLQARLSCQDLLTAMQNQGFMHAGVSLYTTKKGKKLDATYLLHPGEPFMIGKVKYEVEDEHIQQLLHLDNPDNQQIKPGMRFTVETLDNERRRISSLLTNDGYFRFHKDFIQFSADTIAGQKDIALTLHLMKYKANSNAPEVDHPRYEIRNINYLSNDSDRIHLRHQVLLNATALREGRPYSAAALQRTYNNFARLQAVKYTNISFSEVPDSNQVTENGMERDSISRQMDCNIQISTNKPSTIAFQPEGTNTAGDLGAAASLTYTNRNLFRGSEQLSIELRGAYEAITGLEGYQDQNYTEYSVEGKLVFPRFLAPFLSRNFRRRQTANSELSASWNLQNRPEFHRRVFSTAWRYRWTEPRHHLAWRFDRFFLKAERQKANCFSLYYSYGDSILPQIKGLNFNEKDAFILEKSEKNDTLTYWIKDTALVNQDTLNIELTYRMTDSTGVLRNQTDTLEILSKEPYEKRMKAQAKELEKWTKKQEKLKKKGEPYDSVMAVKPLDVQMSVSSQLDPDKNVIFTFNTPLAKADTAGIHLYAKHDTLWYRAPMEFKPLGNRKYILRGEWRPDIEYSLEVDSAAFQDIYGLVSKPVKQGFKVNSLDTYGTLLINVTHDFDNHPLLVQLLNAQDQVVKEVKAVNGVAEFYYLKPEKYYMRLIVDRNGNGKWDTGCYDKDEQAEEVYYYPDVIECKAKWDLTESWDPTARELSRQKPGAITKQKPDKEKKVKNQNAQRAKKLGIEYIPKL